MGMEEGWKVRGTEGEVYREEGRIWEDRSQGGRDGKRGERVRERRRKKGKRGKEGNKKRVASKLSVIYCMAYTMAHFSYH